MIKYFIHCIVECHSLLSISSCLPCVCFAKELYQLEIASQGNRRVNVNNAWWIVDVMNSHKVNIAKMTAECQLNVAKVTIENLTRMFIANFKCYQR